jgi:hypothetical protein
MPDASSRVALSANAKRRLDASGIADTLDPGETVESAAPRRGAAPPIKLSGSTQVQSQQLMSQLVSGYGLTPDQAAAVAANAFRESTFRSGAFNPAGGGQGAKGMLQWRGDRISAFKKMFGVDPHGATVDQQIQFMMNDPYERNLLNKSFAGGGDAATLGARFSQMYEVTGDRAEDRTRGALAAQFAQNAPQAPDGQGGNGITITGPVTVNANDPQALVTGIQRVSGVQSYQSANR